MSRQSTSSAFHKSKTLDNKYLLGDEIGKGAYGRVYKALDLENGDFVAIKQVSLENIGQEELNNIMQEIDLLKNLNHKNIVKYIGSVKTKTHLHIILEYVENGSLADIIKPSKFGPFPESLVAVYIAQVLEGLVYLHEQGVIHRDIKGANILTTKEGLVKLADFGVATNLAEKDINTYSVVGTPYWMAPEVIEMSGVSAASDIWSVGCTVIELLTCAPPYFDFQPMPALFRIVQDDFPPIPDGLSPSMADFLHLCFKKDASQRSGARALLSHPWIMNSRRALKFSLRHSVTLRNIEERESDDAEILNNTVEQNTVVEGKESGHEADEASKNIVKVESKNSQDEVVSNLVSNPIEVPDSSMEVKNVELERSKSRGKEVTSKKLEGKRSIVVSDCDSVAIGLNGREYAQKKSLKSAIVSSENELSRFSDPPGDASLDDLFHPFEKHLNDNIITEASTSSASLSHLKSNGKAETGKNDLAAKLRDTIARKQMEKELGHGKGGDLLRLMMGVLKDDAIDMDGLGFDDKIPAENLFHLEAVEFSKLVSSLRPDETEDVIVSSCQKLTAFFERRPEQKIVFISQHGLLPVMDLLEVPRNRVICSVLQLLNQIIKDNSEFQENACLVGLIPVVMSFAVPDHPREIRIQAAYFLQQLCQSSSFTLQMFLACRGVPVLVGFLEADYAKFREMIHLAIDGIWQVFKLQRSTPRNDFCRIAAKNGILLRLINTLYSLNEATRLALINFDSRPDQPDSRAEFDSRLLQRGPSYTNRTSTERPENDRPLLCLLDKEPPLRHLSGQLEYGRHLTGLENHEVNRKSTGMENLMADSNNRSLQKSATNNNNNNNNKVTSTSASGVLSGSGVLNARPHGSTESSGLLSHMVSPVNADVAKEYIKKTADLLLAFAVADTTVKSYMCSQSLLSRLFQMFNKVESHVLLKLLKCINHLSTDPHCLDPLQKADAIKYLIPNLDLKDCPLVNEIHHEVFHTLFNLCKINKRRQEQAADNGIIPHLMQFIMSGSELKQYALPLLCDLAHASRNSREQLRARGGLDVYLSLLEDELWSVTALDSIAVCLANDNDSKKVEDALVKKDAVQKLVKFFENCPEQHFLHILEPFLKIITKSTRINTTLATNGLTPLLISRLDHQDAIARLNLLKLIKAVYERHPRPKQLIVENDLPQKLQNLIEERRDGQSSGGQVLVKQMATSLLKALHINTVL